MEHRAAPDDRVQPGAGQRGGQGAGRAVPARVVVDDRMGRRVAAGRRAGRAGGTEAGGAQRLGGRGAQARTQGAVVDPDRDLRRRDLHLRSTGLPGVLGGLGVLGTRAVLGVLGVLRLRGVLARVPGEGPVVADGLEELLGRHRVPAHRLAAARQPQILLGQRHRDELRGGRGEAAHGLSQVHQVVGREAGVGPYGLQHRLGDVLEADRVHQDAGGGDLVDEGGEEALLAVHPAEVGGGVDMAGADVLERLAAAQEVLSRGQVQPGETVPERARGADLHPADRIHAVHEAGEVDLQIVVDMHPRHVLDGPYGQIGAALGIGRVQLDGVAGVAPAGDRVLVGGDLGVGVAGQADDAGAVPLGRQMHQHQGVGAVTGDPAQVVGALLLLGDLVPSVGADDQEVQPAAAAGPLLGRHVLEGVHPPDPGLHPGDHGVPEPARGQQHSRGHRTDPQPPAGTRRAPAPRRPGGPARRGGLGAGRGVHRGHLRGGTGGESGAGRSKHRKPVRSHAKHHTPVAVRPATRPPSVAVPRSR